MNRVCCVVTLLLVLLLPQVVLAQAVYEESAAPGQEVPNGLSFGLSSGLEPVWGGLGFFGFVGTWASGVNVGFGVGELWRVEVGASGSIQGTERRESAEGMEVVYDSEQTQATAGLGVRRLMPLGRSGRGVVGVEVGGSLTTSRIEYAGGQGESTYRGLRGGPVVGVEYLFGGALGLGLEAGVMVNVGESDATGVGAAEQGQTSWDLTTRSGVTLRYYF